ncbi:MAG: glycosyltransferase family 2 protein [Deltaproteobacteria bacterium]|nr:glycosyltransferase family 2 protein [Deltaproteobacteria bacterium]
MPVAIPRVSVLILNWNGRELLRGCLRSLRDQTFKDFEVLVVDNGSADDSAAMVRREFPEARLLALPVNTGFCGGNNRAYAQARADLVLLLNNDAEVRADFVEKMITAADLDAEFGMFAACIRMYDRREIFDSTGLLIYPDGICRSRGWLEKDVGQYDRVDEVLAPNGCAAMYRRAMLDDVGFLDEAYFAYLEDLDLGLRGQLRGWRCRYVPDAVVYHKKSMTTGYHSALKAYLVERNRIWNAVRLLPLRLLLLSPLWTVARYLAQGFAAASGRGMSGRFSRDYSRRQLLGILLRAYAAALLRLPEVWRERRWIQSRRKLGALAVYELLRKHRLPLLELAFKD